MLSVNAMLNHPSSGSGPVPAHRESDAQVSLRRGDHEHSSGPGYLREHRSERGQTQEPAYFSISDYEDDPNSRYKKRKFYATAPSTNAPGPGPSSIEYSASNYRSTDRHRAPSQTLVHGTLPKHSAEEEGGYDTSGYGSDNSNLPPTSPASSNASFVGNEELEYEDLKIDHNRVRVQDSLEMTRHSQYPEDPYIFSHSRSVSSSIDHKNRDKSYVRPRGYTASSVSTMSGILSPNKSTLSSRITDISLGQPDNNRIAEYCSSQLAERAKLAEIQASKEGSRAPPRLTPITTSGFKDAYEEVHSRLRQSSLNYAPPSSISSTSSYVINPYSPPLSDRHGKTEYNKPLSRHQPLSPPSSTTSMPTPSPPLQPTNLVHPRANYARRATVSGTSPGNDRTLGIYPSQYQRLPGTSSLTKDKQPVPPMPAYTTKVPERNCISPPTFLYKELQLTSPSPASSSKSRLGRKEPPNDSVMEEDELAIVVEGRSSRQQGATQGSERARKRSKSFVESSFPPSMQMAPVLPTPSPNPLSMSARSRGRSSPPPRSKDSLSSSQNSAKGSAKRNVFESTLVPSARGSGSTKLSSKSMSSDPQALPNEPGYEKYLHIGGDYYRCMEDEEVLHTRRTVMRHEEIHQGKRVECQYCFAKVSRRDAMLRHQRNTCTMIPPHLKERM